MSRQFRCDIRRYNCALCLASLQANEVTFPSGPSAFRVHGEAYRFMEPMCQADGQQSVYADVFVAVHAVFAMQVDIASQRLGAVDGEHEVSNLV